MRTPNQVTNRGEKSPDPIGCEGMPANDWARGRARIAASGWFALATLALSAAFSSVAGATLFTFNFNSLGGSATSTQIGTYMTGVFGSTVGVSGAKGSQTYNGDGHVVGPTLGTSDGATSPSDSSHNHAGFDTFIINNGPGSNAFTLNFGADFSITSISFDWEIFPDASCSPTCSPTGGHWPDIKLLVDGSSTIIWSQQGLVMTNPQNIGVASVSLSGAHSLTFMDWPAEIGIDNLKIVGQCAPTAPRCTQHDVPEPSSLPLAGLALAAFLIVRRIGTPKTSASRAAH
jgi:hypothetical protein